MSLADRLRELLGKKEPSAEEEAWDDSERGDDEDDEDEDDGNPDGMYPLW